MEERFDNKNRKCNNWFTAMLASFEYVNSILLMYVECKISDYENQCVSFDIP